MDERISDILGVLEEEIGLYRDLVGHAPLRIRYERAQALAALGSVDTHEMSQCRDGGFDLGDVSSEGAVIEQPLALRQIHECDIRIERVARVDRNPGTAGPERRQHAGKRVAAVW